MSRNIVTGIDLGDHTIKIVVAEVEKRAELPRVLSVVKRNSEGFRRGIVTEPEEAEKSIRKAAYQAEKAIGQRIKRAYVSIGGAGLSSQITDGSAMITRGDQEITDYDIKQALDSAEQKLSGIANLTIHSVYPLSYKLDGKKLTGTPKGMKGTKLEVKTLFITSVSQHYEDIISAVERAGITVLRMHPAPLAGSLVTLSKTQRVAGCVLADIGAETTTIGVFEEGKPHLIESIEVGSQDITNDIALGLKISLEDAEEMKRGNDPRVFAQKKLVEIIEARLSDIFELIENHLKKIGRNELLPAGIVIVGGGAYIPKVETLAGNYLNLPARIASPIYPQHIKLDELSEKDAANICIKDPSYATSYGLAIFGMDPGKDERSFSQEGLGRSSFGKTGRWLKNFLP
jgi:cell division protein FtsA